VDASESEEVLMRIRPQSRIVTMKAGGTAFETVLIFRAAAPSSAGAERGGGFGEKVVLPETRRGGELPVHLRRTLSS
jgi:hypothetical protein